MKYFTSGYIFLQDKIEQAIIKLQSNRSQLPRMYMQQFPNPCYTYDTFFLAIAGLFPLFMVLSFVYTCAMIVKSIVREKERRLKETMKTMGLGNAVHWVAWFIDSMSFMLISCVLLSMILVVITFPFHFCHACTLNFISFIAVWRNFGEFKFPYSIHFRPQFQYCHHLLQFPSLDFLQPSESSCCLWWVLLLRLFPPLQLSQLKRSRLQPLDLDSCGKHLKILKYGCIVNAIFYFSRV